MSSCASGESPYRLLLRDTGADGWGDDVNLVIYATSDHIPIVNNMESGAIKIVWACMADGDYAAAMTGVDDYSYTDKQEMVWSLSGTANVVNGRGTDYGITTFTLSGGDVLSAPTPAPTADRNLTLPSPTSQPTTPSACDEQILNITCIFNVTQGGLFVSDTLTCVTNLTRDDATMVERLARSSSLPVPADKLRPYIRRRRLDSTSEDDTVLEYEDSLYLGKHKTLCEVTTSSENANASEGVAHLDCHYTTDDYDGGKVPLNNTAWERAVYVNVSCTDRHLVNTDLGIVSSSEHVLNVSIERRDPSHQGLDMHADVMSWNGSSAHAFETMNGTIEYVRRDERQEIVVARLVKGGGYTFATRPAKIDASDSEALQPANKSTVYNESFAEPTAGPSSVPTQTPTSLPTAVPTPQPSAMPTTSLKDTVTRDSTRDGAWGAGLAGIRSWGSGSDFRPWLVGIAYLKEQSTTTTTEVRTNHDFTTHTAAESHGTLNFIVLGSEYSLASWHGSWSAGEMDALGAVQHEARLSGAIQGHKRRTSVSRYQSPSEDCSDVGTINPETISAQRNIAAFSFSFSVPIIGPLSLGIGFGTSVGLGTAMLWDGCNQADGSSSGVLGADLHVTVSLWGKLEFSVNLFIVSASIGLRLNYGLISLSDEHQLTHHIYRLPPVIGREVYTVHDRSFSIGHGSLSLTLYARVRTRSREGLSRH